MLDLVECSLPFGTRLMNFVWDVSSQWKSIRVKMMGLNPNDDGRTSVACIHRKNWGKSLPSNRIIYT